MGSDEQQPPNELECLKREVSRLFTYYDSYAGVYLIDYSWPRAL